MTVNTRNIIIAETSEIIVEGISAILSDSGHSYNILSTANLCDIEQLHLRKKASLILINPSLIQNQLKFFQSLKKELDGTKWAGIVYSYVDPLILAEFNEIIYINKTAGELMASIQKLLQTEDNNETPDLHESLSERETEVLKLLVSGMANKEIAEKLNISTHTVISHRKNISQKTGIKSVSGLTIYAVVRNIITIDNYSE